MQWTVKLVCKSVELYGDGWAKASFAGETTVNNVTVSGTAVDGVRPGDAVWLSLTSEPHALGQNDTSVPVTSVPVRLTRVGRNADGEVTEYAFYGNIEVWVDNRGEFVANEGRRNYITPGNEPEWRAQ